ncbi:MAG: hypothetical protein Q8933_00095 [Bacteroidota bacterium]|nr:hypothetical protein [Bacteroidota bacterium]
MSSFSCPHLNEKGNTCLRLKTDCVPGRKGCVLSKKFQFAVPVEERIKMQNSKEESKKIRE